MWKDDKLNRRSEALALERFLINEMSSFERIGFDHAYVLAIDSPYGVGKSWFLDRFSKQLLAKGHAVAKVDAWTDDSGEEPMVAIMSAIEDAIKPYLTRTRVRAALEGTIASFGKVLFEGTKGSAKKLGGRLVGDDALGAIADILSDNVELATEVVESGTEEAVEAIATLTDKFAKTAIENYKRRQKSVATFKSRLAKLKGHISGRENKKIFIFVDELDRCRPSYAIRLLEEVKHIFDVSGVAFIFAIHAPQLEAAICAVYGSKFDGKDYLRRFFTTKYSLSVPDLRDMVSFYFERFGIDASKMNRPLTSNNQNLDRNLVAEIVAKTLQAMDVSSRSAISILRALKIFTDQWNEPVRFDVVYALYAIYQKLFEVQHLNPKDAFPRNSQCFGVTGRMRQTSDYFSPADIIIEIESQKSKTLLDISNNYDPSIRNTPVFTYVIEQLIEEAQARVMNNINRESREYFPLFLEYHLRSDVVSRYLSLEQEEIRNNLN